MLYGIVCKKSPASIGAILRDDRMAAAAQFSLDIDLIEGPAAREKKTFIYVFFRAAPFFTLLGCCDILSPSRSLSSSSQCKPSRAFHLLSMAIALRVMFVCCPPLWANECRAFRLLANLLLSSTSSLRSSLRLPSTAFVLCSRHGGRPAWWW